MTDGFNEEEHLRSALLGSDAIPDEQEAEVEVSDDAEPNQPEQDQEADASESGPADDGSQEDGGDSSHNSAQTVPIAVVHSERDKRRAAEKLAEEARIRSELLEAQLNQRAHFQNSEQYQQPQQQFAPQQHSQPQVDPQQFAMHVRLSRQELLLQGEDASEVDAADLWAADQIKEAVSRGDTSLQQQMLRSENPVMWALQRHREHKLRERLAEYGGNVDSLIEAEVARRLQAGEAVQQGGAPEGTVARPAPRMVPKSMAGRSHDARVAANPNAGVSPHEVLVAQIAKNGNAR